MRSSWLQMKTFQLDKDVRETTVICAHVTTLRRHPLVTRRAQSGSSAVGQQRSRAAAQSAAANHTVVLDTVPFRRVFMPRSPSHAELAAPRSLRRQGAYSRKKTVMGPRRVSSFRPGCGAKRKGVVSQLVRARCATSRTRSGRRCLPRATDRADDAEPSKLLGGVLASLYAPFAVFDRQATCRSSLLSSAIRAMSSSIPSLQRLGCVRVEVLLPLPCVAQNLLILPFLMNPSPLPPCPSHAPNLSPPPPPPPPPCPSLCAQALLLLLLLLALLYALKPSST